MGVDANARASVIRRETQESSVDSKIVDSAKIFQGFLQDNSLHSPSIVRPDVPDHTWTSTAGYRHTIDYLPFSSRGPPYHVPFNLLCDHLPCKIRIFGIVF